MVLKFDVKPKNILSTLILRFLIRSNTWHMSKAMSIYALPTLSLCTYSRVRNKRTPTFINFSIFSRGYGLINDLKD